VFDEGIKAPKGAFFLLIENKTIEKADEQQVT
jgi:hypothetical protein